MTWKPSALSCSAMFVRLMPQARSKGASAEVNMETGISQVFPGLGQRVHGLFVHQSAAPGASQATVGGGKH